MENPYYINDVLPEPNNQVGEPAITYMVDVPKTQMPLGNVWKFLHELTASDKYIVAMQLLKEAQREHREADVTPFVLSIGKKIDLSDVPDEKKAYRQHLREKYTR